MARMLVKKTSTRVDPNDTKQYKDDQRKRSDTGKPAPAGTGSLFGSHAPSVGYTEVSKTTTTKATKPSGGSASKTQKTTTKATGKPTPKPKVTYPTPPKGGSVKNFPLPADVSPGKLDVSDVARARTYIKRLSGAALGRKRTEKEEAAFQKYSGRAKSYAARIDKASAARRKAAAGKK